MFLYFTLTVIQRKMGLFGYIFIDICKLYGTGHTVVTGNLIILESDISNSFILESNTWLPACLRVNVIFTA